MAQMSWRVPWELQLAGAGLGGLWGFFAWMFKVFLLGPLWIAFAMIWWTVKAMSYVVVGILALSAHLARRNSA